jgi:hypothetical protein
MIEGHVMSRASYARKIPKRSTKIPAISIKIEKTDRTEFSALVDMIRSWVAPYLVAR